MELIKFNCKSIYLWDVNVLKLIINMECTQLCLCDGSGYDFMVSVINIILYKMYGVYFCFTKWTLGTGMTS